MTKRGVSLAVVAALLAAAMLAVVVFFAVRKDEKQVTPTAEFRSPAVMITTACIAAVEKPSAIKVLLCGEESYEFQGLFETFGYICTRLGESSESIRYDIVFVSGEASKAELGHYAERLSESGVLTWRLKVGAMTCGDFQRLFARFPCPSVHLWMPGSEEWVLVGRRQACKIKLEAMMELFARESAFDLLADAKAFALSDIFASYAGTRDDIEGAFADGAPKVKVRPEFFVTTKVPEIDWITKSDVDDDIYRAVMREIRSMQVVRREILKGNIAVDQGRGDEALEIWMNAVKRNPRDPMMQERLGRLTLNANALLRIGNASAAAKCFESIIVLDPLNASAVFEYGKCLQMLGRKEQAQQVFKRAKELEK